MSAPSAHKQSVVVPLPSDDDIRAVIGMLSLFLNATRTPLETTDKIGNRTSPLG